MSKDLAAYIETAVKEKVVPVLASNNVRTDTFMTALQIAVVTHKDAAKFSNNKASLYTAIVRCANDGLLPDGKEAALIIYNEKQPDGSYKPAVQYQPMAQGLVKLARNSGEIVSIDAEIVFENDFFEYSFSLDGNICKHSPYLKEDRGNPYAVWCMIKLKSGETILRVLTEPDIESVKTASKQKHQYETTSPYWKEFWRKAAIKNTLKYAPKSTRLDGIDKFETVIEADNKTEFVFDEEKAEKPLTLKTQEKSTADIVKDSVIDAEYEEQDQPETTDQEEVIL
jgi:recombination protein RecT